tara:strand:+ start:70 stop:273 length:204 start_codon:yes stop_codon:yes gene_type:complete
MATGKSSSRAQCQRHYPRLPETKAKGTGETELYNLAKDPFERQNLAESKASRVKRLTKQLNALLPES